MTTKYTVRSQKKMAVDISKCFYAMKLVSMKRLLSGFERVSVDFGWEGVLPLHDYRTPVEYSWKTLCKAALESDLKSRMPPFSDVTTRLCTSD